MCQGFFSSFGLMLAVLASLMLVNWTRYHCSCEYFGNKSWGDYYLPTRLPNEFQEQLGLARVMCSLLCHLPSVGR